MELELADVSLRATLENGLTMHSERAAREGVALGLRLEPEEISVRADERKIRQVVFNLLSNAVKLTPSGGRVDVVALRTRRRRRGGSLRHRPRDRPGGPGA